MSQNLPSSKAELSITETINFYRRNRIYVSRHRYIHMTNQNVDQDIRYQVVVQVQQKLQCI
jgi:hypothetical protein